jgi:thioredoxin 1
VERAQQLRRIPMADTSLVKHAGDSDFETQVLKADKPALVDFWAPWCGPCRAIGPVLEELAKTYEGKVNVVKVNVDEHPGIAQKYSVRSIPTLLFVKEGQVKETMIGLRSREQLSDLIDKNIN